MAIGVEKANQSVKEYLFYKLSILRAKPMKFSSFLGMQSFTNKIIFAFSLFHLLVVLVFMVSSFGNYGKIEKVSTQTVTEKASN